MDASQFQRGYEEAAADSPERLLAVARNMSLPAPRRLAALWRFLHDTKSLAAKEFLVGECLEDSDPEIRRWAVRLASTIGSTSAGFRDTLRRLLATELNPHRRSEVLDALAATGDDTIAQECLALLTETRESPPVKALVALERIDTDEALQCLEQLMSAHADPLVRRHAALRLVAKGIVEATRLLEAALSEDLHVAERAQIAFTLASIGNEVGQTEARRLVEQEFDAHHEEIAFAVQGLPGIGQRALLAEDIAERRTIVEAWLTAQRLS